MFVKIRETSTLKYHWYEFKQANFPRQTIWQHPPKPKIGIHFDLAFPLSGNYPTETLAHVHKGTYLYRTASL